MNPARFFVVKESIGPPRSDTFCFMTEGEIVMRTKVSPLVFVLSLLLAGSHLAYLGADVPASAAESVSEADDQPVPATEADVNPPLLEVPPESYGAWNMSASAEAALADPANADKAVTMLRGEDGYLYVSEISEYVPPTPEEQKAFEKRSGLGDFLATAGMD